MYAFAQRADTAVLDEPLYAHFLRCTGARRPDREATLAGCDADGLRVLRESILAPAVLERPFRFCKHIVNQWVDLPDALLTDMGAHVLFIRDPRRIVASYAKVVSAPRLEDVALPEVERFAQKLEALGLHPVVLDSADLLTDPEGMLRTLCTAVGQSFDPAMLHWPSGPRPEDGPWAPWWYKGLHASTGFRAREAALPELEGPLAELAEACMPAYQRLRERRLLPETSASSQASEAPQDS